MLQMLKTSFENILPKGQSKDFDPPTPPEPELSQAETSSLGDLEDESPRGKESYLKKNAGNRSRSVTPNKTQRTRVKSEMSTKSAASNNKSSKAVPPTRKANPEVLANNWNIDKCV